MTKNKDNRKKFRCTILVNEEILNKHQEDNDIPLLNKVEREFGWLEESGIILNTIKEEE